MFRVVVTSSDGQRVAVTVQVDTHRKVPSAAAMNDLADRLRIPRGSIDDVLADWTPERLTQHLSSMTKAELWSRAPKTKGTPKLRIACLTKRAAASKYTFYEPFANKEACACAAYRFTEVIRRLQRAPWSDPCPAPAGR